MPINVQNFIIPEIPVQESAGLQNLQRTRERQGEIDYRAQKDAEADQWKKLNLIQDLTDLSKHQTGSDVANAVGYKKAAEILQKYTQAAPNMTPNELMAKVQQEMNGVVTGMDAMKNELDISDEELKLLKQAYPELDIPSIAKEKRADILNRRMSDEGFINPLEVKPSEFDLSDPEILSKYLVDDRTLVKAITDPKGVENESVLMGKQGDYTKFEGKVPFWKRPNYDRTKYNSEGFYTGTDIPSLVIKGSELPSEALPSSNGKPFKIIDKDVYEQFTSDGNQRLSLMAATRRRFPDYDKFNPTEKEYAQRNTLYEKIETLDQSQLHPTQNVRPQVVHNRSTTNINMGGIGGGVSGNEFDRIQVPGIKKTFLGLSTGKREKLSPDALPERVYAILKSAGMDVSGAVYFDTELGENGEIQSIIPYFDYSGKDDKQPNIKKGSRITRQDMYGAQLKYNAEPQKGEQPTFGESAEPRLPKDISKTKMVPTIKGSEVPKGSKVTEKDGKYYYNGKEIIQ